MKEFNLERALASDPVVTQSGIPVTELKYFEKSNSEYKIAALVAGSINTFTVEGKYHSNGAKCSEDLYMASVKKQYWVNIYKPSFNNNHSAKSYWYETEDQANDGAVVDRVACIMIEVEE